MEDGRVKWRKDGDAEFTEAGAFSAIVRQRAWAVEVCDRVTVDDGTSDDPKTAALRAIASLAHEALLALPPELRVDPCPPADADDRQQVLAL